MKINRRWLWFLAGRELLSIKRFGAVCLAALKYAKKDREKSYKLFSPILFYEVF